MIRKHAMLLTLLTATAPIAAGAQVPTSTGDISSNGSSTGVGNAGSFGIGSGTSDSIATATSDGIHDSSTNNSVDNSLSVNTVSIQDLQASITGSRVDLTGSAGSAAPASQTGGNVVSGSSLAGFTGILTNGWNTAPMGIAQAATSIAVNGNVGGN